MYGTGEQKLKRLREKWSRLLKGIKNDETRDMTAIVLENQEGEMRTSLRESTISGYGFGPGTSPTPGSDIDKFPKLMIPMVRRIMPQLIANEIFGVQAMEGPVGMAFTLRWVYDTTVTWTDPVTGRVYTTTADSQAYIPGSTNLNPVYSGDWNNATYESAVDDATANTGGFGLRNDRGELLSDILQTPGATYGNAPDGTGGVYPYSEGSLKIINRLIEARTRKLKANWSQEAVDDIKKVHSLNLEQEIVDFLSYQIQAEIDRELILAAYNLGTTNGLFTWDLASTDGRWQEEKYKTLYHAIVKALNYIGHQTRRGRANWMVVSSEVASILSAIKAFDYSAVQPVDGFEPYEGGEGVVYLGTIESGKVKVYLDLYWEAPANNVDKEVGYILMGYKGKKSFDSGILYCPYIPVMMMKTISPHDFHPLLSLGSRYAIVTQLLDTEKYYAVVSVRNSAL
jgi:hypothetical protein